MKTGSLRDAGHRSITLSLLALVLAAVVTAVTLAYRAKLDSDLAPPAHGRRHRVQRAGSGDGGEAARPGPRARRHRDPHQAGARSRSRRQGRPSRPRR